MVRVMLTSPRCTTPIATGRITPTKLACRFSSLEPKPVLKKAVDRLLHRAPAKSTPASREIVQHFNEAAADEEHFPSTIDPRIYHVQLILEYFGDLDGKRVLDVGCGKGRFARVLQERHPAAEIWGLDISEEMLKPVPAGIH